MKRVLPALFIIFSLLVMSSCENDPRPPATDQFKVALLTPGPVSDAGWNALAYEGLMKIRETLHAEVSQIETKTPAEFEEAFRDYASRGFQLVFGHGFEFQDAAAKVAADFPETVFITTSGSTIRPNVAPMRFLLEEATYLMGVMSAQLSKTGKAGAIGGIEIPPLTSTFMAFEAGAKSINPDFQVIVTYIGNWEDAGAAKQAALALIEQGCDLLIPNADAASLGVFQAARERKVWVFGTNKNQNDIAPDVVIASGVIDIPTAFLLIAQEVLNRQFQSRIMRFGMKEDVISLVYNSHLQPPLPSAGFPLVEKIKQKIIAGELTVPSVEFSPHQPRAS